MTTEMPERERLETRRELNEKLYRIRREFNLSLYAILILIALNNFFLALALFIPLWLVMAATYTTVDNYYEKKYLDKVLERRLATKSNQ